RREQREAVEDLQRQERIAGEALDGSDEKRPEKSMLPARRDRMSVENSVYGLEDKSDIVAAREQQALEEPKLDERQPGERNDGQHFRLYCVKWRARAASG